MLAPAGPVHPSATARELAAVILHPPLAPAVEAGPVATLLGDWARPSAAVLRAIPTPAYDWLLVPAIGLLPPTLRDEYGFAWGTAERAIAAWLDDDVGPLAARAAARVALVPPGAGRGSADPGE